MSPKHPWLGPLPGNSQLGRLKFGLAGMQAGGTPDTGTAEFWSVRGTPWVTITDMSNNDSVESTEKCVTAAGISSKRLSVLPPGTLLYSMYASLGHVAELGIPAATNQAILGLEVNARLNKRYAYWQLKALQPYLNETAASNTQDNLNAEKVKNLPFAFLPLAEQTRIANFLDEQTARIDALIAEKERFAACMEEYRRAQIYALVTRGSGESMKFPTHVAWLGEVPAHWRVVPIKQVARLESGHTPDKKVSSYWEKCDIPWVSLNDTGRLLTLDYIYETTVNINQAGLQNSSARLLPEGTVFFSRDATIGRCGIAARPMACSQHFIGWVCGPHLLPEYLLYVLRSMSGELERLTAGATLKTIGMDDVKKLAIPLPPLEEQRCIVALARSWNAEGVKLQRCARMSADLLREYRSSLILAAVTGQLDIDNFKRGVA